MFSPTHLLSDWPGCVLEVRCPCSPRVVVMPVRLLLLERGDRRFSQVTAALRCSTCRGKPSPVFLIAGHSRSFTGGGPPDWAVELVPPVR